MTEGFTDSVRWRARIFDVVAFLSPCEHRCHNVSTVVLFG